MPQALGIARRDPLSTPTLGIKKFEPLIASAPPAFSVLRTEPRSRLDEVESLVTPRLERGSSPLLTVGGRRGRFNFDVQPETGGTPKPRYAFDTDTGGRWFLQLEKDLQGGRWEEAHHAEEDFKRYKKLDPQTRTATMQAMWGKDPIASVVDKAASEGVSFATLKERLKLFNTHRQISNGEPTPAPERQVSRPEEAFRKATGISAAPQRTILDRAGGLVRAPAAGVVRVFTKPAWGVLELAADALGLDGVAEWSRKASKQAGAIAATVKGSMAGAGPNEQALYSGLESVGVTAPALIAGAMTGSPNLALGIMGAATAGETYGEDRAVGVSPARSAYDAGVQGATEILTELMPAGRLLGDLAKRTGLVKTILRQIAVEVPGEQGAELVQSLSAWTTQHPDKPLAEWAAQRKDAAAQTLIATVVGTIVQAGGAVGVERLTRQTEAAGAPPTRPAAAPGAPEAATGPSVGIPPVGADVTDLMGVPASPVALARPSTVSVPSAVAVSSVPSPEVPGSVTPAKARFTEGSARLPLPSAEFGQKAGIEGESAPLDTETGVTEPLSTRKTALQTGAGTGVGQVSATFLGWQETGTSEPPSALYNIVGGDLDGSTVSAETLQEQGIAVPPPVPLMVTEVSPPKEQRDEHSFSTTQVNLPDAIAKRIIGMARAIPDEDIETDGRAGDSEGSAPHVTVKYGLHTNDVDKVAEVIKDEPPITVRLGSTSYFPNGESGSGDVLKFDVDSPDLQRLNAKISEALDTTDTHPGYTPHVTVAYLKAGKGKDYEGDESLSGQMVTLDRIRFSTKEGRIFEIPLTGVQLTRQAQKAQTVARGSELPESEGTGPQGRVTYARVEDSLPTGRESGTAQAARRAAHYAPIFSDVYRAAKAVDPTATRHVIRAEFDARVDMLEELDREYQESDQSPRELLEAIARHGGISMEAEHLGGLTGELRWVREGAAGPFGNFGGVPNVFRRRAGTGAASQRTGLSLDEMATLLQQDQRFSHITGPNELMAELEDIARLGDVGARGGTYPGTASLAKRAGIQPGEAWWTDSWQRTAPPAEDAGTSFNVEELEADPARERGEVKEEKGTYEPAPIFYSQLRRVIDQKMPNRASRYTPDYARRQGTDRAASDTRAQGALVDLDRAAASAVSTRATDRPARLRSKPILRALGIRPELVQSSRLDIRGQVIRDTADARDLATLAQVVRDPRFETFRVIYTKAVEGGHEVLATEAISSRLPDAATVFLQTPEMRRIVKENTARHGDEMTKWPKAQVERYLAAQRAALTRFFVVQQRRMSRLGADGYYLLHNHPSGNAAPSLFDLSVTVEYGKRRLLGLKGHVIIDSGEYTVIQPDGKAHETYAIERDAPLHEAAVPHAVLGKKIVTPAAIREVGQSLVEPGQATLLFGTQGPHRSIVVRAVETVPASMLNDQGFTGFVKNRQRQYGGSTVFLLSDTVTFKAAHTYVRSGLFEDVVTAEFGSPRELGAVREGGSSYIPSYRVQEETPAYGAKEKRQKQLTLEMLAAVAQRRGVTVEAVRKAAEQAGYVVVDGPPSPKSSVNVDEYFNFKRVHLSEKEEIALRASIARVVQETGRDPKERVTFQEIRDDARALHPDAVAMLAPFQAAQAQFRAVRMAARQRVNALNRRIILQQKHVEGLVEEERVPAQRELHQMEQDRDTLLDVWMRMRSDDGRALAMHRMMADSTWEDGVGFDHAFWMARARWALGLPPGVDLPLDISRQLNDILTRGDVIAQTGRGDAVALQLELADWLRKIRKSGLLETITAVRKAGLLTGLKTHGRNLGGSLAFQVLEELSRAPAVVVDTILGVTTGRRTVRGVSPRAMARAVHEAATKGWRDARQIMRTGASRSDLTKMDVRRELNSGIRWLDRYVNFVFRTMGAEDRLFKSYAFRQSLEEQVKLRAINTGEDATALLLKPTDGMIAEAIAAAEFATFNNPNVLAEGLVHGVSIMRRAGRAGRAAAFAVDNIILFKNTPANIVARTLDYGPVGAIPRVATATVEALINQAMTPAQQRAISLGIGRGLIGSGIMAAGWYLAAAGLATGSDDDNEGDRNVARAARRVPGALLIDGAWRQVATFSPIGNLLTIGATMYRERTRPLRTEAIRLGRMAGVATRVALDQPMLTGVNDFLATLDRPGARAESTVSAFMGSFVPTIVSDAASLFDPYRRDARPEGVSEMLTNGLMARIPFLRHQLPVREDVLGRPEAQTTTAIWDATLAPVARELHEPVLMALIRYDVGVAWPTRQPDETTDHYRARARVTGRLIERRVREVMAGRFYRDATEDDVRRQLLERAIAGVRGRVRPTVTDQRLKELAVVAGDRAAW